MKKLQIKKDSVLMDDDTFENTITTQWHIHTVPARGKVKKYVARWTPSRKRELLHRTLMNAQAGEKVVFLDKNTLNLQYSNMRIAHRKFKPRVQRNDLSNATAEEMRLLNILQTKEYQKTEKGAQVRRDRQRKTYQTNINYKMRYDFKAKLNRYIKDSKYDNKEVIITVRGKVARLGCVIKFFKAYIEKKFKPGMSWSNHGTVWELHHIVEISRFDLNRDLDRRLCFTFLNYAPLYISEHRAKGNGLHTVCRGK